MSEIERQHTEEKFYEADAGDGTKVYDQYLTGIPLYLCLIACFITLFLIGLDQTIITALLEEVGNKFNSYNRIGWVSSGYLLTMSVLAPTWGKISIKFGRKSSVLGALLIFEAGSLMCALASSMNVLIGGRVLAGVGGGGIQSLTFIIGSELVPIHQRPIIFTVFGCAFAISTVCGPLVGGAFTERVTWRWCFYVNLPLGGMAALFLILFFKPPRSKWTWKERLLTLDYIGTALCGGGIVLILLAITFGGVNYKWNSAAIICLFIFGGITSILFCIWNFKYSKDPIIPYHIIVARDAMIPISAFFFIFFVMMSGFLYISTYFLVVKGDSPLKTGVRLLPLILSLTFANIFSGIVMKKSRYVKPFPIVGTVLLTVGTGLLMLLKPHSPSRDQIGFLILPGLGLGFSFQTSMVAAQMGAPKQEGSLIMTTALYNFSRSLGGALGAVLATAIFNTSVKNYMTSEYLEHPEKFGGFPFELIYGSLSSPSLVSRLTPPVREFVFDCFTRGLRDVFAAATAASGVAVILTLFYSNKRIPKEEDVKTKDDDERETLERKLSQKELKHDNDNNDSAHNTDSNSQ